jgi:hypothetical protein
MQASALTGRRDLTHRLLAAHVHTALSAGGVLLAACLVVVLALILPVHPRRSGSRPAVPEREQDTATEPVRVLARV